MKRNLPLPIPQKEFALAVEAFNLFLESGDDGERLSREREEAAAARARAETAQPALLPSDE